jgi:alpha-tubulin suppressor-like RCC1 family protein
MFADTPTRIPSLSAEHVTSIAAGGLGSATAAATTSGGTVVAWGDGSAAGLGDARVEQAPVDKPVTLPGVTAPAELVGGDTTYALSPDGKVTAWGFTVPTAKGYDIGNNTSGRPVHLTWLKKPVLAVAPGSDFPAFLVRS